MKRPRKTRAAERSDRADVTTTLVTRSGPAPSTDVVTLAPRSVWRAGWVLVGVGLCVFMLWFVVTRGGGLIFNLVISAFLAVAMEPAVKLLSRYMRRGLATAIVLVGAILGFAGFVAAFGGLLVNEIQLLIVSAPDAIESAVAWANSTFGTDYSTDNLLDQFELTPSRVATWASQVSGGVFAVLTGILGGVFNAFAILLFTTYMSASMPKLRDWIAGLFTPTRQSVVLTVWEVFVTKVGGYVTARLIMAFCSATAHSIFMVAIGMDYWLALGLWVGVISQFVPTIGTYIAIVLPALVGLTSDQPLDGVLIVAFAIGYQQFENLILDPRVSSRAVDVHPGVSFASVLLGAQLFGVAGGLLAVPVAATLTTIFELYMKRYEISPDAEASAKAATTRKADAAVPEDAGGDDGDPDARDVTLDDPQDAPVAAAAEDVPRTD